MGFFDALSRGLERSREALNEVFYFGGEVDEDFWEDLEDTLVMGDMGAEVAIQVSDDLRDAAAKKNLKTAPQLRRALAEQLEQHFVPIERDPFSDTPSCVLFVGINGAGKTTLINLLMRFYDVQGGQITIDGTPVQQIGRKALRKNFGMVLQDTWLKCGSILENIRMGNPGASYDEVVAAAKKAHAHSFIQRLPEGYYTKIGEDGGSLSQGQKQLLCIARIMLCNPSVLILDEATSSIDTTTEMRIQKAFLTLMEGRTSFIVAHRLSTIKGADLILVMKDGTIIEQGTHASLLADKGFYYHLYNSQFPETDQLA